MQWNMQALLSLSDAMLKELRLVLTCHFDPSDAGLDGPPTRTDVPVPQAEGNSAVARNAALRLTQKVKKSLTSSHTLLVRDCK